MSGGNKRAFWDLAIGSAGLIYVALVLFINLDSPLFGVLVIVLAGHELLRPQGPRRG
jgi:hypothetical protein